MDTAPGATELDTASPLRVPARTIPAPRSISAAARAALAPNAWGDGTASYPPPQDADTWRLIAAEANKGLVAMLAPRIAAVEATVNTIDMSGIPVFEIVPTTVRLGRQNRINLDIHGGGLVFGGGEACRSMGLLNAKRFGLRTWAVDYRVPPDHPYPASLDDCLAVYRALLDQSDPGDIVVSGASAGGNLAAALMLRARDEGLPLPAAVFLFTPEVDLTESGDTFQTNLGIDNVLTQSLAPLNAVYAAGHDLAHPFLSPLFGDFTKGFPRTFLQAGTRDLFLSNTVRMHRRLRQAGIGAELHVFEAMPHGGFSGAPEDDEIDAEVQRYLDTLWP